MNIRELTVALGFEVDDAGFDKAEEKIGTIKKAALGLGIAFAGSAIYGLLDRFVDGVTEGADEIGKMAESFGVTTEGLQKFLYAADIANVGADQMRVALSRLSAEAFNAANGSDEAGKKFEQLGIHVRTSTGQLKSTETLFREVADKIAAIPDPTERTARAIALFGREGARLIPLLNGGSKGLDAFAKEADALGGVMSADFIHDSDDFQDGITRLNFALQGLKATVVHAIMPAFRSDWFTSVIAGINKLLQGTEYLRVAFVVLGAAALLAGAYMLLPFLPAILVITAVGAAVAGVIAVIEDLYMWLTGGASLIGPWLEKIGISSERVKEIWDKLRVVAGNLWDAVSAKVSAFLSGSGGQLEAWFTKLRPLAEKALDWIDKKLTDLAAIDWGAKIDQFTTSVGGLLDKVQRFLDSPALGKLLDFAGNGVGAVAGGFLGAKAGGVAGSLLSGLPLVGAAMPMLGTLAGGYFGGKGGGSLFGEGLFGGGGAPTMPAPAGGGSVTSAPHFNMEIEVNGAPGMDPNGLAVEVAKQVDQRIQSHAQDLYTGLVPSYAAP